MAAFTVSKVRDDAEEIAIIKRLFSAYAASLNIDLTFQDYTQEFTSLPGKYSPPTGELLLARSTQPGNMALGCIALRLLQPGVCEFKRLYVVPAVRGLGVGRKLVEEAIMAARELCYVEAKLDTLPTMKAAMKMYGLFGFVECEKYYDTPIEGTEFMSLDLTTSPRRKGPS